MQCLWQKILCAAALSLSSMASFGATKPTFVLVHGALFTSSGWSRVQTQLQDRDYNVVTLDVPGRGNDGIDPKTIDINKATAKVCKVAKLQSGPVILVGHSQGGALITQATAACGDKIRALVYIAAVVPLSGEIAFQSLNPERDNTFPKCVDQQPDNGLFKLKKDGPLEASFFPDLRAIDPELADFSLTSMVSEPMAIGTTPLKYQEAKFKKIPKFYIEATEDKVVSPETQQSFQKRTPMKKVFQIKAGHSPFLSQPQAVTDALVEVAKFK